MTDSSAYPVRAIYDYFKVLERESKLEGFLKECDDKKLTLDVSKRLFAVGHRHLSRSDGLEAVGPDCPLCPEPPGF